MKTAFESPDPVWSLSITALHPVISDLVAAGRILKDNTAEDAGKVIIHFQHPSGNPGEICTLTFPPAEEECAEPAQENLFADLGLAPLTLEIKNPGTGPRSGSYTLIASSPEEMIKKFRNFLRLCAIYGLKEINEEPNGVEAKKIMELIQPLPDERTLIVSLEPQKDPFHFLCFEEPASTWAIKTALFQHYEAASLCLAEEDGGIDKKNSAVRTYLNNVINALSAKIYAFPCGSLIRHPKGHP